MTLIPISKHTDGRIDPVTMMPISKITVEDARQATLDAIRADGQVAATLHYVFSNIESACRARVWYVILGIDPVIKPLIMDELKVRGFQVKDMSGPRGNLGVSWSRVPDSTPQQV